MEEAKKGILPMSHGIHLSKTQCPMTTDERERMNKVPYASAIGSIMYAMIIDKYTPRCFLCSKCYEQVPVRSR